MKARTFLGADDQRLDGEGEGYAGDEACGACVVSAFFAFLTGADDPWSPAWLDPATTQTSFERRIRECDALLELRRRVRAALDVKKTVPATRRQRKASHASK